MRIVHFDQMFHPDFGDQINLLSKYQVKQGHEVYIVTGKNDVPHPRFKYFADNSNMDEKDNLFESSTGVKIIRIGINRFISGRAMYKKGYKKIVDNLEPDILFCHFNDTVVGMYYTYLSGKLRYPVVFDSHMLEMASTNRFNKIFRRFYRYFLTPIIKKNRLIVIKTQDDNYVNKHLGIPKELTPFISFGSDTSIFYPDDSIKSRLREENDIEEDDFVVVYTGKFSEGKGGKLLAEVFRKKFETNKRIVLIAVGNTNSEYEKEVEEIFRKSENRIIRFPTQKYIDLPKFYQTADLSIFPKQCSLSFYDAQACGLPVIAEDNNINIDRLNHNNGLVYNMDDYQDFRNKIIEMAELKTEEYNIVSQNAYEYVKNSYDYKDIAKEYTDILTEEYNRFHKERDTK